MSDPKFQRNTRQREVILEELRQLTSHPTAARLHEIVRRRLPKISLGTVYRNLELMAEMGAIQKLQFSGAEARFDGNPDRHDHLRCIRCNRVDDLPGVSLDLSPGDRDDSHGYRILGHRLELLGICAACQNLRASTDGKTSRDGECD
ncbi:MAG TPA: transcriptional repressor [Thermoguttaceae bacterium]|nr:transcriptional repressor [Thermoguttaceae bacterium]